VQDITQEPHILNAPVVFDGPPWKIVFATGFPVPTNWHEQEVTIDPALFQSQLKLKR